VRFLFVHQNMPAQYAHLVHHFARDPNNEVVFITRRQRLEIPGVRKVRYELNREPRLDAHRYVRTLDEQLLYGQAVVRACLKLQEEGFTPDIICVHSGWGEGLFLKDVYPDVPVLNFAEYYYHGVGADVGFGGEAVDIDRLCRTRMRNVHLLMSMEQADWNITPTVFQWQQLPEAYRPRTSIIHDGVRTNVCVPNPDVKVTLPDGTELTRDDEVVTYLSRNLERYRGFDVFMRALPLIQKARPNAHVIVVGGDDTSYGAKPADYPSWREKMQAEVAFDPDRVHFMGRVPYSYYLSMLQLSRVQIYLTFPFVLSWSLLESMSVGCCIVASDTPPLHEAIIDGETGVLTDFFDHKALCDKICALLDDPERRARLGAAAREFAIKTYDLETVCLPQHLELIRRVAARDLPSFSSTAVADDFPGAPPVTVRAP
jgi:glycosyltransferase involved in cell wall biosynthesis